MNFNVKNQKMSFVYTYNFACNKKISQLVHHIQYCQNKNNFTNIIFKHQILITYPKHSYTLSKNSSLMSYLQEISEQQSHQNIKKLINQNKKLRQQILVFEDQINHILSIQQQQQKTKLSDSQITKSLSLQKKSSSQKVQNEIKQKAISNQIEMTQQYIDSLLQTNSPLIETRVIPAIKQQLELLKCQNIKENAHYILKQEDELKILKKELNKFRKEKQVITSFIKDKSIKLQMQNSQLTNHKNTLRQQLNSTVKFNRQSSSQITELEREIRKYHLTLQQFKKLSSSTLIDGKDKDITQKLKNNPSLYFIELTDQAKNKKNEIYQIQSKWKQQLDSLDKEYYQLKEQLDKKDKEEKLIQNSENFHNTRVLVMKDQEKINSEKQRQKLAKVSPKLQKQMEDYLKQQQQKLRKKQQYLSKHYPRDREYQIIQLSSGEKSQNPQKNTVVESVRDDKNIIKLKNYLKQKEKVDKQTQANLEQSMHLRQNNRLQRSWSSNQQKNQQLSLSLKLKDNNKRQIIRPRLLLKNVKLGTTFHNDSQQSSSALAK